MSKHGFFVTFEGIDGSGKSLQAKLLTQRLENEGYPVLLIRDPGTTAISEEIRNIVLNAKNTALCEQSELLLFEAARAQMVSESILPALESNKIVICDRFYDSTTAYQGYGRGLKLETVDLLNQFAAHYRTPDLTFLVDTPLEEAADRKAALSEQPDRMENENDLFKQRVRDGFLKLAETEPDRVMLISGKNDITSIAAQIWSILSSRLG